MKVILLILDELDQFNSRYQDAYSKYKFSKNYDMLNNINRNVGRLGNGNGYSNQLPYNPNNRQEYKKSYNALPNDYKSRRN